MRRQPAFDNSRTSLERNRCTRDAPQQLNADRDAYFATIHMRKRLARLASLDACTVIDLGTLASLHEHRHQLAVYCPRVRSRLVPWTQKQVEQFTRTDPTHSHATDATFGGWAIASAAVLATACASQPKPVPVIEVRGKQIWTATDMVDVAITELDRDRVDQMIAEWLKYPGLKYHTGPMWARLFGGEMGKSTVFEIRSARLEHHFEALGFSARISYRVDGFLTLDGRQFPVHAEGTRHTEGLFGTPESDAIQRGVIDAARKVKFIVSGELNSAMNPAPSQ